MTFYDLGRVTESASASDSFRISEPMRWRCVTEVVDHYRADFGLYRAGDMTRQVIEGNTLTNLGGVLMFKRLVTAAAATGSSGGDLQSMTNANAAIAVGISTATAAVTQTDLQAATGSTARWIKGMSTASYPSVSTANTTAGRTASFQCVQTTSEANFAQNEWALFNDPNSTGVNAAYGLGLMLNRKVQSLGTKTSAATRTITVTLSLA